MKILHVYDIAGVSCIIAKYQRKLGHDVKVIGRSRFDPFGFLKFYGEEDHDGDDFMEYCVDQSKQYDIVHLHALPEFINLFSKPVIIHYHGNDVIKPYDISKAKSVILSTSNLLKYKHGEVISNPVDTEHFKENRKLRNKDALTFQIRYNDIDKAIEYYGKPMDVIDRDINPIPYSEMPNILNQYNTFVDIKFDKIFEHGLLQASSKTAYEALACGLDVVTWELKTIRGLPDENNPYNIAKRMIDIYEG